jgi:hypothetical protein
VPSATPSKLSGSFAALAKAHERFGRRQSAEAEVQPAPLAPARSSDVFAEINRETRLQHVMTLLLQSADYYGASAADLQVERARLQELDDDKLEACAKAYGLIAGQVLVMSDELSAQRAAVASKPKLDAFYRKHGVDASTRQVVEEDSFDDHAHDDDSDKEREQRLRKGEARAKRGAHEHSRDPLAQPGDYPDRQQDREALRRASAAENYLDDVEGEASYSSSRHARP